MLLHVDGKQFKIKPTEREIGALKVRFANAGTVKDLSVKQIAAVLTAGKTIQPGVCPYSEATRRQGKKGTSKDDFARQTVFLDDIDNKLTDIPLETPAHVAEALAAHNLKPAFMYETFNSTADNQRFRFALVSDTEFTDKDERDRVQAAIIALFPQSDLSCTNADRMFFGTDKGLIDGYTDFEAVCAKPDLLALADAMQIPEHPEEAAKAAQTGGKSKWTKYGETIPTGERHGTLVSFAATVLKKYGITDKAYEAYMKRVAQCEEPKPDSEIEKIWCDACAYYERNIAADPNYRTPNEYAAQEFAEGGKKKKNSISHYMQLSNAYKKEHTYVIGVQRLVKGGFGNDTLYEYAGGVWKARSESDVKSDLAGIVTRHGNIPDPTHTEKAYKVIMSTGKRKDVETFNADENLVCFQNGVYRLSDGAVLEHSPEYYFTLQLNASIPAKLEPTPYCDMCLANFGGADVQTLLLEIFGGGISNVHMYRFKKAVLQYGVGDSGKTQLKGLVERVVGAGNYNNVDLSDLENNRFLSAAFQNVRIGGSNDMSNVRVKEEKVFKQLTGGDSIQAENKGENSFTFRYKGLLWFLANQLPLFGGDKGEHVYNRWIVIPCRHAIPEEKQIKDLQDRMFAERDSFCIKALQAFRKAVANNYTFSIPASCQSANDEYRRKNSVVRTFIEECCEPFDRDTCTKEQTTGKLWAAFKTWCAEGLYYTPGKAEFRKELAAIAGVDESDLESHTKDGNFYPYVVTMQALKEIQPGFLPPLYG